MKHYYVTCLNCGANLDPDEKCDCKEKYSNIKEEKEDGNND
ncbi:hypothetical protein C8E03_11947 [Lachnotalea glycerini]|uniref:Uncharacterized protein n=1 Tax=Lachnotalea glycerini TaxID=1763509 RepID=A0A318ELQ2_9FIRM|nr:hypothetical protein [Lachnotalea glycerini]PXV85123.1 hypothetical protein C8E03_11947 [Lachnotalea glycerini]